MGVLVRERDGHGDAYHQPRATAISQQARQEAGPTVDINGPGTLCGCLKIKCRKLNSRMIKLNSMNGPEKLCVMKDTELKNDNK